MVTDINTLRKEILHIQTGLIEAMAQIHDLREEYTEARRLLRRLVELGCPDCSEREHAEAHEAAERFLRRTAAS